jgi:hypothetical protein
MEPTGEYREDDRLIFWRLEKLESEVKALMSVQISQQASADKAKRDVDEAHSKLRLLATRERYRAWTAIAAAVSACIALLLHVIK